eukprot:1077202_1
MSWPPLQDGADEVTMMDVAAGLGQKRKLSPEPSANTAAKHSFFWKRMHSNHGTFIGSNHSTENESNLNAFYDETQQVLEIERTAAQIKCCCIPIELYLDRDHRERYRERIENEGLNALARQWYQQSIERSNDGTFRRSRDRVRKHCVDIDKVREMIKLIQCNHALNKYLQEMFDKKDIDLLEYF